MKVKYQITMEVEVENTGVSAANTANAATLNDAAIKGVENIGWYGSVKVTDSLIVQKTFPKARRLSLAGRKQLVAEWKK